MVSPVSRQLWPTPEAVNWCCPGIFRKEDSRVTFAAIYSLPKCPAFA
jgi:hypothetical protein